MTDVENIERLISRVFGVERRIRARGNTNRCIAPLNTPDMGLFAYNFHERLARLSRAFGGDRGAVSEIAERVKNIGEAREWGWAGPYSELVALDFYSQFREIGGISFVNRLPVSRHRASIAARSGRKEIIDIDLMLDLRGVRVFSDVKSFNSVHLQILDAIFADVEAFALSSLGKSVMVGVDNLSSVDYREVKSFLGQTRPKIRALLVDAVSRGERSAVYEDGDGLRFDFKIGYSGALSTVREYSPFAMAEAYRYKFLDYGPKLLDDEYSVITVVKNPWFNGEVVDFGDFNNIFYRALSRRTFMELLRNGSPASAYSRQYAGSGVLVSDVPRALAGIFFIDDNSQSSRTRGTLYSAYLYLNPNYAVKEPLTVRRLEKAFRGEMEVQLKDFDDFKWDNY